MYVHTHTHITKLYEYRPNPRHVPWTIVRVLDRTGRLDHLLVSEEDHGIQRQRMNQYLIIPFSANNIIHEVGTKWHFTYFSTCLLKILQSTCDYNNFWLNYCLYETHIYSSIHYS